MFEKRRILAITVVGVLLGAGTGQASLIWDVYSDAEIGEGEVYGRVHVYDTPPEHTTLNMLGGNVDLMEVYDSSTVNVSGGEINSLFAEDMSTVSVSGGEVGWIRAQASATVNVSGGRQGSIDGSGYPTINFSGQAATGLVRVSQHTMLNMTGGSMRKVELYDSVIVNLRAGVIPEGIVGFGFDGVVNVYGHDLAKTRSGGQYGHGQVSGFYPDGSAFTVDLGRELYSRVNLIPEPATLLLLSLGVLIARARKS
ncbi:MAG: PEP-CTERM sorting domain-containing protein [Phycisphaerales bacterium]|nr:MAG: PEP-CTERM sorting domain-containing protein [Phycisphaerales bacterium]